jgi:DNA-binding NarL/FixJ family response regulator
LQIRVSLIVFLPGKIITKSNNFLAIGCQKARDFYDSSLTGRIRVADASATAVTARIISHLALEIFIMVQRKKPLGGATRPIRIILADDHQIVRQDLGSLLEAEPDMEIVAEADNGHRVLKLVEELVPDVILMDLSTPELNGIEATRRISSKAPHVKVIALSMNSDGFFVTDMIRSGASGYLLKDCALEELVKAIRTVVDHKTYLSPGVSYNVVRDFLAGWKTTTSSAFSVLSH